MIQHWESLVFTAFLLCWVFNFATLFFTKHRFIPIAHAGLAASLAAAVLVGLRRRLPFQNVVAVALVMVAISFAWLAFAQQTGAFELSLAIKFRIFGVPLILPIYWTALAICAREFSRLALRSWRNHIRYGYWLIALSVLSVLLTS